MFRMNLQLRRCYYNFTGCYIDSRKDSFEGCACEKVDLYNTTKKHSKRHIKSLHRGNLKKNKIVILHIFLDVGTYHLTNL